MHLHEEIWTLRVKLPLLESEWVRLIEIKSSASFLDLHEVIQTAVDFDNDHLFDFFVGRSPRSRAYSIGPEPNWDTFDPIKQFGGIHLYDVWPVPKGMKVFYLFDFGDNWLFQINKTRHKDKLIQPGIVYPRVIEARGEKPEQYPEWEDWDE
jgi:hypothetical protein